MYRILLAFGVLTCVVGMFFFGGGLVLGVDGRAAIVRGLAILTAGLCVIAICDIQRRIVFLRAALEQVERNQSRLMETVAQQGQALQAFQAATLSRLDALAAQPAAQPEPEPVVAASSYEDHSQPPIALP